MGQYKSFAEQELNILLEVSASKNEGTPIVEEFRQEIIALCDKFGKSQSSDVPNITAAELTKTIKNLLLFEPLAPIMNVESEWFKVADYNGILIFQNKRCPALFKDGVNGRPYFLDALVWKTADGVIGNGSAWDTSREFRYRSRQTISHFPFYPKTFYIDVHFPMDSHEYVIKDMAQLDKAKSVYLLQPF